MGWGEGVDPRAGNHKCQLLLVTMIHLCTQLRSIRVHAYSSPSYNMKMFLASLITFKYKPLVGVRDQEGKDNSKDIKFKRTITKEEKMNSKSDSIY